MRTTVEVIGPEQATKYLERNENNRKLRKHTVDRYAEMMRRGQWKLTHEAIAFDTNGELKNGQHRLAAVIESGATVSFSVTRGVDPDTYSVIDSGAKRSTADRVAQLGKAYATTVAPALRYLRMYEIAPDLRWVGDMTVKVNDQDILAMAEQIDDEVLAEAGVIATRASKPDVRLNRAAVMTAYLLIRSADPSGESLKAFYQGVISGEGLLRDDPRLALRRWAASTGQVPGKGQKTIAAQLRAWNAFVKQEPLRVIKLLSGQPMPEVAVVGVQKVAAAR